MSFPSKNTDSMKDRHMVKTCFFRKEICRHQSALVITMTQHLQKVREHSAVARARKLKSIPQEVLKLWCPFRLYLMGANGPGLCTPASKQLLNVRFPGGRGWSSIIPHRAKFTKRDTAVSCQQATLATVGRISVSVLKGCQNRVKAQAALPVHFYG